MMGCLVNNALGQMWKVKTCDLLGSMFQNFHETSEQITGSLSQ